MKKLQKLYILLCFLILCIPVHAFAHEGFAWEIVSDQSPAEQEENGEETTSRASDAESDSEPEAEKITHDPDNVTDTEAPDKDSEKVPSAPEDESPEEEDSLVGTYPSGNIYSQSETEEMIREKYVELREAYEIKDKFKKTKTIDSIDSFILNFCGDPLKGKKIVFLGDSITAGNGGTLTPDGSGLDYTNFIAKYTAAEIINLGIGGAPFEGSDNDDALVHRYTDIPQDADIIVLFAGINDLFAGSDNFGSLKKLEEGTYCGDIYRTFRQIHRLYPDAEVYVVITYPNRMEKYEQFSDDDWQDYADVQIALADKYDFNVINLYEEGFMDNRDYKIRNAFFKDDIHPDDLGSEVLGRHILVHLLEKHIQNQ